MLKPLLLLLLLVPAMVAGQVKISGKIVAQADKKPISSASVFLNNSVVGSITGSDGTFTLVNVRPGQYTLIVTVVGYEAHNQVVLINDKDVILPTIDLIQKTISLQEVVIKPNTHHDFDFRLFKALFLGPSENSQKCDILNPEVIDVDRETGTNTLTASSDEFIKIENKALGYLIKYKLNTFSYTSAGLLYFDGISTFEELKGSESQQRRWKRKRQEAYLGSTMHFLRSAIANKLSSEGYRIVRLSRKLNPDYKPGTNSKMIETLNIKDDIPLDQYMNATDVDGLFAMGFADCLYVMYTKRHDFNPESAMFRPKGAPSYAATIVTFQDPHLFFDNNGTIVNPHGALLEGVWGAHRVADILPVDYVPEVQK